MDVDKWLVITIIIFALFFTYAIIIDKESHVEKVYKDAPKITKVYNWDKVRELEACYKQWNTRFTPNRPAVKFVVKNRLYDLDEAKLKSDKLRNFLIKIREDG